MSVQPPPDSLLPWALSILGSCRETSQPVLAPVSGDASARRYFRFSRGGTSYVAVEAPPSSENNEAFVKVRALLETAGARVPTLLGFDFQRGYLLLEDLGDQLLLPALDGQSAEGHYRRALEQLLNLSAIDTRDADLPVYDRDLLGEELSRFGEWFVAGLLGYQPTPAELELIAGVSHKLLDSALEQPRVLVHRDFHSRNLMLLDGDALAVIDFQDAVIGPVTYDLVSLLRDCYIQWPASQVRQWALDYLALSQSRGTLQTVDEATFLRWFDWMGLQRHLKVLGNFARLSLRDGKSAYLRDLPLVIHYVLEVLEDHAAQEPLFAEFAGWYRECLSPRVAEQDWSRTP